MAFMASISPRKKVEREVRRSQIISAQILHETGELEDTVIRNVSRRGLGVSARDYICKQGEHVTLVLPGKQKVSGTVRWNSNCAFGVQLDGPLDVDALVRAIQNKTRVARKSAEWAVESRYRDRLSPQTFGPPIRRV